jgi:hypothetical protein
VLQLEADDSQLQSVDSVAIELAAMYVLSATAGAGGTVLVAPPDGPYAAGTIVSLTAIPGSGRTFTAWSGDASGSENPLSLEMSSDKAVHAAFSGGGGGGGGCGVGPELAVVIPLLAELHRRRHLA